MTDEERKTELIALFEKHQQIKAEGYAGMSVKTGFLCDRREEPDALPIPENSLLGVPQPRPLPFPRFPRLPFGFDRWVFRGLQYRRDDAYMWTSFDPTAGDTKWDPPCFSNSKGDAGTYYIEAVIDHHAICRCIECRKVKPACARCDRGDYQLGHADGCPALGSFKP